MAISKSMANLPEIDALDHHRGPFVAMDASNCLEDVLDIAMAEVFAFHGRDGSDVYSPLASLSIF